VGYRGEVTYDNSKPEGKLVDISRLAALGWKTKVSCGKGWARHMADFLTNPTQEK